MASMKQHLVVLTLLSATAAFAHGSSHPPQNSLNSGSVVDAQVMPRALSFSSDRVWQSDAGEVLICPFKYKIAEYQWRDMWCYEEVKEGKETKKINRWTVLQDYKIDGMVLLAYQFQFDRSSRGLVAYFGKPQAPTENTCAEKTVIKRK